MEGTLSESSGSLQTHTALDRSRRRDDTRVFPTLIVVGSAANAGELPKTRVISFDRLLAIGRRAEEMSEADSHWVVRDELVSRVHCTITRVEKGWELADHGSRNGTAVDGSLVKAPTTLKD